MSSSDNCNYIILTLKAEAELIKKHDKGEKYINLAKEYGVGGVKKAHQVQQLLT
jgi:hypothetical protein